MRDGLCKSRSAGVVQGEINESSDQIGLGQREAKSIGLLYM